MSADPNVVIDLKGFALFKKWKTTLARARKQRDNRRGAQHSGRSRVRLASLAPIKKPVFILGCPRSGTTFLGQVMDSIPSSSYYFEPPILKYYSRLVFEGSLSTRQAWWLYRAILHSLLFVAPGNGRRVIEKNPKHTWIAETLLEIFPDSKFVFIHRDGRDVALSLAAKPWHQRAAASSLQREPGGYLYGPYAHFYIESDRREEFEKTTDYHRTIWIWRRYAEEMARLKHSIPGETQFHMTYENLVSDPETTLGPLLQFLEEPTSVLDSIMKVAGRGHATSVGKWRTQLGPAEQAVTESEAGEMLRMLGYADSQTVRFCQTSIMPPV